MDKYTYNLKTDKILQLVRQEDYTTAAKIADTFDWTQEHNVRLLTAVAEAYEKTEEYDSAIDILLNAYEQAPIGKRILYKLTELALKAGHLNDAETFYKKYLEEAPEENDRYILRYLIAEAKGEDLDKRIVILETYKKYEFEEEWACRLAELYQKAGRREECVALCDEIILWFGVGPYVEKAMELKEVYEPLTESQREHRENRAYYEERLREAARESEEEETADVPSGESAPEETEDDDLPVIAISAEVAAAPFEEETAAPREEPADRGGRVPAGETESRTGRQSRAWRGSVSAGSDAIFMQEDSLADTEVVLPMEGEIPVIPDEPNESVAAGKASQNSSDALDFSHSLDFSDPSDSAGEWQNPSEEWQSPQGSDAASEESVNLEKTKELNEIPEWMNAVESSGEDEMERTREFVPAGEEMPEPEEEPKAPVPEEEETSDSSVLTDSGVLPVLSFEETEQAMWEDQNRRMEELEPLESYELEHCIFISAGTSDDGIDKAVEALDEYYSKRDEELPKIAKIVAGKLNHRGIIHSLPQLSGKDLIIDEANDLSDAMIGEMLEVLDCLDKEKVFVLMDAPTEVTKLKQRVRTKIIESENENTETHDFTEAAAVPADSAQPEQEPEQEKRETQKKSQAREEEKPSRRVVKVETPFTFEDISPSRILSEDEFIRYAEYFAGELECVFDDSVEEALLEEIDGIREEGGELTAREVQAVVEEAAEHAEKFTVRRLFASKYDKDGYLILRNRDFL